MTTTAHTTENEARVPRAIITHVEVEIVRGPGPVLTGFLSPYVSGAFTQVGATNPYRYPGTTITSPGFQPPSGGAVTARYVRIGTDAGIEGRYGPIDAEAVAPLLSQIAPRLIGNDALSHTVLWDYIERADRHSRQGHYMIALSAVDNALWDIRGKAYEVPVWRLLGGASRDRIPAYLSTLGVPLDDDTIDEVARMAERENFAGQKWFLPFGPAEGDTGLRDNLRVTERARHAAGDAASIMADVHMGWDLPYALKWARHAQDHDLSWLEEPFAPSRPDAFRTLAAHSGTPLSAGEHLYSRADALPYLRDGVIAYLQSDPEWCGGVTEFVRICALADLYAVPVIPHGHGIHASLHAVASQSPAVCPKVEYLDLAMAYRLHFEDSPPTFENGAFALPQRPGFGIELDDAKIDDRIVVPVPHL